MIGELSEGGRGGMTFSPGQLEDSNPLPHMLLPPIVESPKERQIKRPHNAYNLFFIDNQQLEKEKHPTLTGNEISQLIGKKWSDIGEAGRAPYRERARVIWQRFRAEYPDYHYQKSSEKRRKKRDQVQELELPTSDLFLPLLPDQRDAAAMIELQLRNLFTFVGSQAVTHYALGNKPVLKDIVTMIKNFSMAGGGGLEEGIDVSGLGQ
jgi:hypothetical protein